MDFSTICFLKNLKNKNEWIEHTRASCNFIDNEVGEKRLKN